VPRWDNEPQAQSRVSNINFDIWKKIVDGEVSINIPWKIYQGRQSSFPLGALIKGIARVFIWRKCLGGIMHLKPTAGFQISTLIFEKQLWRGLSINIPWKIYQERQSSCPLGFELKVLLRSLTDVSVRWDNAPQAQSRLSNINFDIWKKIVDGGVSINIPWKIYQER
jgi:hypothetical protein